MRRTGARLAGLLGTAAVAAGAVAQEVPAPRAAPPVFTPFYPYGEPAPPPVDGAVPTIATLPDAIRRVYALDPTLLSERALLRSTDYRYPQARAAYGPTLSVQASGDFARDRFQTPQGPFERQAGLTSTAGAVANLPLYTFGRNAAQVDASLAQIAFGRDTLRLREAQAILGAITGYVGVQRDRTIVDIAEANLRLLERQFADSADRFQAREITSTDLQQVETRVALGRAQLVTARGQLGQTRSQFVAAVGALPGEELARPEALGVPVDTLEAAIVFAQANSPILRSAQSREKISRAQLALARADQGPRLDLNGQATYGTVTPYANDLRTTRVGAGVTFQTPLIDSGFRRARVREAEEANDADQRLIDQAVRDTVQAVTAAWNGLAGARDSLNSYAAAVDAAQRAYDGALEQERAGFRTTLDVLDLARDLLNARNSFAVALANEYLGRANLLAAMGTLEAPLLLGVEPYDPGRHFAEVADNGDVPVLTRALASLDEVGVLGVDGDRAIRDPSAPLYGGALVALPPESAVPDEPAAALELPPAP